VHESILLGYIGLLGHEIMVLKSIFKLAPQLSSTYKLVNPDDLHDSDVVLVNADSPEAVIEWNRVKKHNSLANPLMLSADGQAYNGEVRLQRPIRIQKLINALEDIVRDRTAFDLSDDVAGQVSNDTLRVLVVDDSYPVRKYMENKLQELIDVPAQLSFASSGEEAMLKLEQSEYDIIFLDVVMEGVDGYKVCRKIKSQHNVHIAMLTSKKSPFDKVRGTMSGCDAYVTKPPTDQRLKEEVEKSIKRLAKK